MAKDDNEKEIEHYMAVAYRAIRQKEQAETVLREANAKIAELENDKKSS